MRNNFIALILIIFSTVSVRAYDIEVVDSLTHEQDILLIDTLLLADSLSSDTLVFDVPDYFVCDLDSMLNSW